VDMTAGTISKVAARKIKIEGKGVVNIHTNV